MLCEARESREEVATAQRGSSDVDPGRYAIYKTSVGGAIHQRACKENAEPHSKITSVPLVDGVSCMLRLANGKTRQLTAAPHAHFDRQQVHVVVVPILADNYCYLLVDEATSTCLAVDPSGADRIHLPPPPPLLHTCLTWLACLFSPFPFTPSLHPFPHLSLSPPPTTHYPYAYPYLLTSLPPPQPLPSIQHRFRLPATPPTIRQHAPGQTLKQIRISVLLSRVSKFALTRNSLQICAKSEALNL